MKIARVAIDGAVRWAAIDADDVVRPIRGDFGDWTAALTRDGASAVDLEDEGRALDSVDLLAPLEPGSRIFGCGANYWEHLRRGPVPFSEPPKVPVAYLKPEVAIIGPGAEITYPSHTEKLDYEVELVAVLGRDIEPGEQASAALLGFTVGNDVSIRDTDDPLGAPDLYTMKAADGISPLGPWIVTADELGGLGQPGLAISLSINGEERQRDVTSDVIFPIDDLLRWVNVRNRLHAGDVIYTGTPHGTAFERGEGYLQTGDLVEAEIEGIGVLSNRVGAKVPAEV